MIVGTIGHSSTGPRRQIMANTQLIEAEWNQLAWGNYETNLDFLRRVDIAGRPGRVLEIGCGKGAMLNYLREAGHTVSGIDIDEDALAHCREAYPAIPVSAASGDDLPFEDGSFDTVMSFDAFEHISRSDRHLAEVRRVLKSGGRYLLQTPNKWTNIPFEIVRQCKKFHIGPLAAYRALLTDHCALHNYWQLQWRFAQNGFDVTFVDVPVVNEYFRSKVRTYLGGFGSALLAVVNPDRFPRALRTNFYVSALKRSR